jgi:rhodanese-related sulfurtransferase/DNA-binding transcriptional ArsR family regulator
MEQSAGRRDVGRASIEELTILVGAAIFARMGDREFKDRLYEQFARVAQALASDKRLELVDVLAQGPRHVDALAGETGMSVANVSQHLQTLRAAGLVESRRLGNRTVYRLADPSVVALWIALRGVAESRLAEVERLSGDFLASRAAGPSVSRDEAQGLGRKQAVLLDVRPRQEFEAGHLRGAINIPLDELTDRIGELPRDRKIIAYCRGEYCGLAFEAADLLLAEGFDVVRLEGGWPEWQSEDRPVDLAATGGMR